MNDEMDFRFMTDFLSKVVDSPLFDVKFKDCDCVEDISHFDMARMNDRGAGISVMIKGTDEPLFNICQYYFGGYPLSFEAVMFVGGYHITAQWQRFNTYEGLKHFINSMEDSRKFEKDIIKKLTEFKFKKYIAELQSYL